MELFRQILFLVIVAVLLYIVANHLKKYDKSKEDPSKDLDRTWR